MLPGSTCPSKVELNSVPAACISMSMRGNVVPPRGEANDRQPPE
jgi:hypothetical protein